MGRGRGKALSKPSLQSSGRKEDLFLHSRRKMEVQREERGKREAETERQKGMAEGEREGGREKGGGRKREGG